MNTISFTHELIKGKIAEIIFEQMIHSTKGYTILEFGYEKVVRQLAKERKNENAKSTIEIIRRAPDFAVINENTHEITLIEVKYMNDPKSARVLRAAKDIKKSWKKASLFVASPDGFYYDSVDDIIANKGSIQDFKHSSIPTKKMSQFLDLLNEFIAHKS
jgi:hypothetical protein